jgi:hypothetical protein
MKDIEVKLVQTVNDFLEKSPGIKKWDTKPSPEKWSPKEILGHLIDSAHINLERFVRCTYEENFKLIYFQDEWVTAQHYQDTDEAELLKLWELVNLHIARVLAKYPPERQLVKCDTGRYSPQLNTLAFLAEDYVRHMRHHLHQIMVLNDAN